MHSAECQLVDLFIDCLFIGDLVLAAFGLLTVRFGLYSENDSGIISVEYLAQEPSAAD